MEMDAGVGDSDGVSVGVAAVPIGATVEVGVSACWVVESVASAGACVAVGSGADVGVAPGWAQAANSNQTEARINDDNRTPYIPLIIATTTLEGKAKTEVYYGIINCRWIG